MIKQKSIIELIEKKKEKFTSLSDRVFDTPETLFKEYKSVKEHINCLEAEGFKITKNLCNMPTAVMGETGDKGPIIAFLGEFDALPNLSQVPFISQPSPVIKNGNGHGCGHNLLGAASLLAASVVKDWIKLKKTNGQIRYYGCPAEEGGAAKTYMAREGIFKDVDIAISWHPATFNAVNRPFSLANTRIDFMFSGKAAHASSAPHLGRSALDAAELMSVGVNYLREHMPSSARVHYSYLNSGGNSVNVIPDKAAVRYLIRASNLEQLRNLIERIEKIAEGASLMTETSFNKKIFSGVSNLLGNRVLEKVMQEQFEKLGPVIFDMEDHSFANKIRDTLTSDEIASSFDRVGIETPKNMTFCDFVAPLDGNSTYGVGSTDVGDVSWNVPTVQARVATCAVGTPFHTWQLVAQGKTKAAHKGMVHAAKIMALTAIELFKNPVLINSAKQEHLEKILETPYRCPIPPDINPPIILQSHSDE